MKEQNEGFIFWFNLRNAARNNDWALLERELKESPTAAIPRHPFNLETLSLAAEAGRRNIVHQIISRGFSFESRRAGGAFVRDLAVNFRQAMPVVHYLLQTGQADPVPAMQALAAKGDIEALKDICCSRPPMHVHALTSALSYALAEKQGDVASLLIKQGANIYHADVAAAGRSAAPALYAALLLEDKKDYIEAYEEIGGAAKDLEHFRYVPPGYGLVPVSRLHIAARAGFFEDVVSVCHKEKKDFFTVKDILETDSAGVSLLDVMVARGDVQKLFDPRLWCQDPPAAEALRLVLKERGMEKENLDPASLQASIRVYKLRQQYDPARFKLKPPGR